LVLQAGLMCTLRDGEESENTATCMERVASDLIALTTATAIALQRGLADNNNNNRYDAELMKQWCLFYQEELVPKTRSTMKRTSRKLDAYGLYLPSRMGAAVPPELIAKGLTGAVVEEEENENQEEEENEEEEDQEEEGENDAVEIEENKVGNKNNIVEDPGVDEVDNEEEVDDEDEYEYEEVEYYDDEEEEDE